MTTSSLAELCLKVENWQPKNFPNDTFTYIDLSAVDNRTKKISSAGEVLGKEAPSRARQKLQSGDVLVSTVRPNLNSVAYVSQEFDGATASTGFTVLRPGANLDGRFLFHFVQFEGFIRNLVAKSTGANYPAVSDKVVKDEAIPFLPIADQIRASRELDSAFELMEVARAKWTMSEQMRQSHFTESFGTSQAPIDGVRYTKIADCLKLNSGRYLSKKDQRPGLCPVYGANGQTGKHDSYMFTKPVVTIGRVGSCGAINVTKPNSWVSDNALIVTETDPNLPVEYLADALRLANLGQYASQSNQPLISLARIGDVEIPIPTPEALDNYVKYAQTCATLADILSEQIALSATLYRALSYKYFKRAVNG